VLKSQHPKRALLGAAGDTVTVNVPQDQWIPGDSLYFIETFTTRETRRVGSRDVVVYSGVRADSTVEVNDTTVTRVTWAPAVIGCETPATCNPTTGPAQGSGYTSVSPTEELNVLYFSPLGGDLLAFDFEISPTVAGRQIAAVTARDLSRVKVVPNPYVMFSQYEQTLNTKRLLFTNLPPTGVIRIYTASGQFVQQIRWTEDDLERNCAATTSTTDCQAAGDLHWNMRTKEDLELGPGFYLFVVTATVGGKKVEKLGKFVVIH
jgi:hypothetical protein